MRGILSYNSPVVLNDSPLSAGQIELDHCIGGISESISDWKTFVPAMVGGLAYRLGRVGALSFQSTQAAPLLSKSMASLFGFTCEVSAFRTTHSLLTSGANLTSLRHSFNQQWLKTAIDFAAMRGMGSVFAGQNIVLGNFAQSAAMVMGNELGASVGLVERDKGNWVQRFAQAQVLNMQMAAGMAMGHFITGGSLQVQERALDLQAETLARGFQSEGVDYSRETQPLQTNMILNMQAAGRASFRLKGEPLENTQLLILALEALGLQKSFPPSLLLQLSVALHEAGTPPILNLERLSVLRFIPSVHLRRIAFLEALLQRERAPHGEATGVATFVDFPTVKAEADRVAEASKFLSRTWHSTALRQTQSGVLLADCNFGRLETYLKVVDHHGLYGQEKNSTEQLIIHIEETLRSVQGDRISEVPSAEQVEAAIKLLNIREVSTDNLGDGGWCVWMAQNQRRVLTDPSLRDLIRRATHFEDFNAFGNNYDRKDPAVRLQAAIFKRYGDNLKSKNIFGSDRFPPEHAREVIAEASRDITALLENAEILERTAQEFWEEVDRAREIAERSIILEREVDGRRAFAFYNMLPLRSFSIFAQWLAVPDIQRNIPASEKLPLQTTVTPMPSIQGPQGEVLRILPIVAIPDGRALPSRKGLLEVLSVMNAAEAARIAELKTEGRIAQDFRPNFWFGKESVILPAPNNGGTVLTPEEIATLLMKEELALFRPPT